MYYLRKILYKKLNSLFRNCSSFPVKQVDIPVCWGTIAVKQWGEDHLPGVICSHGLYDNAGSYDTLIPLLPRRFKYLAYDNPGHGESSHLPHGLIYTDWSYIQAIEIVKRHYNLDEFGIICHSVGGLHHHLYSINNQSVKFIVSIEACLPSNTLVDDLMSCNRRIKEILASEKLHNKGKSLPPKAQKQLINEIRTQRGKLDADVAALLLKRSVLPDGDGWRFSDDRRIKNEKLFHMNNSALLKSYPYKLGGKACFIDFVNGRRFVTSNLYQKILRNYRAIYHHVEVHVLNGHHHTHITNPEVIATTITNFLEKE